MNPQPDGLGLAFLGTIAAFSVLQGLLLLGAAWSAFRAVRRTEHVAGRVGAVLRPSVHELARAARDAAEVSDLVLQQARRIDALVTETVMKVERAQGALQRLMPVAGRLAGAARALDLLRSGVRVYRRLRR